MLFVGAVVALRQQGYSEAEHTLLDQHVLHGRVVMDEREQREHMQPDPRDARVVLPGADGLQHRIHDTGAGHAQAATSEAVERPLGRSRIVDDEPDNGARALDDVRIVCVLAKDPLQHVESLVRHEDGAGVTDTTQAMESGLNQSVEGRRGTEFRQNAEQGRGVRLGHGHERERGFAAC